MSELIKQGAIIFVVGYVLVFVVLSIIWGILELSRLFFTRKNADSEKTAEAQNTTAPTPAQTKAEEDDDELIAVLTAAVAASMGRTSTYNLNIKSYRRVNNQSPAWNRASRQENLSQN